MNSESTFWVLINTLAAITIITIVTVSTLYFRDYNDKVIQLVEAGTPPIEAVCALRNAYGDDPICMVLAAKSATK